MSNVLEYKGYQASIEFSAEDRTFFGKILHIPSLILFEADSVDALKEAFHQAVDDYLEYCRQNGMEPNKGKSGSSR
jgi:predicted HicB family RNase H-like nuclease